MTNPLDMMGPQFLVFYATLAATALFVLWWAIREMEPQNPDAKPPTHAYQIAYLRGGPAEVVRVAVVSLVEVGLLRDALSGCIKTVATPEVNEPIERLILDRCYSSYKAIDLLKEHDVDRACKPYRDALRKAGLIATPSIYLARLLPFLVITGGTVALGVAKIVIALSRGRYNIEFLVVLILVFLGLSVALVKRRRTALGSRMLKAIRHDFSRLKERSNSLETGRNIDEAIFLAAIFGIAALPHGTFPYVRELFPRAEASTTLGIGGCGGGGCGGGGCGGGGCGGGCGGCGG